MTTHTNQPHPLFDPFIPSITSWSIVTALSTGIFDAIAEGVTSSDNIARKLKLDPEGVTRLLEMLSSLGYLKSAEAGYKLTDVAQQTLLENSPHRLKNWVKFCRIQLTAIQHLEKVLTTREHINLFDFMTSPEDMKMFHHAMAETAKPIAGWVADSIPVKNECSLMLDIGGSHGIYSAAVCARHAPMKSEVLELPEIINNTRAVAEELGTSKYIEIIEGDILKTELINEYDLIFLGNVLHHIPEEHVEELMRKLYNHIKPGGTLAIWDFADNKADSNPVSIAFSLFFYLTSSARCYKYDDIKRYLADTGFKDIEKIIPQAHSPHILYTARKL